MDPVVIVIIVLTSVVAGALGVWLALKRHVAEAYQNGRNAVAIEMATMGQETGRLRDWSSTLELQLRELTKLQHDTAVAKATAEERAARIPQLEAKLRDMEAASGHLRERNAQLAADLEAERKRTEEKVAVLTAARDSLSEQFKSLAHQIFEERGTKFIQHNKESLEGLLGPLDRQLKDFRGKIEEVYLAETRERHSLQGELKRLMEMNTRLSTDATNLTNALKGENKAQGNWGEVILERVLEESGLQKGREYDVQVSLDREDGGRSQPDVLVRLPEKKHLIIDSKMSLKNYELYAAFEPGPERDRHLRAHIDSVRRHVAELSKKNYQALYGIKSLDFVLMFLPIEPAFRLAAETDRDLYSEAFRRNILMVGPSTLLISMKTIASIWRYEYQNRNAQELVRHCAALYDKFVGFVDDLEDVGERIGKARDSYEAAHRKLTSGRGNLVKQVEAIRTLGVKPGKSLPPGLLDLAGVEEPANNGLVQDAAERG